MVFDFLKENYDIDQFMTSWDMMFLPFEKDARGIFIIKKNIFFLRF